MKRHADDCVHCPQCNHHLHTWGEVQQALRKMKAEGVSPTDGGWTVCPACASVIHMRPDGEHVMSTEAQIEAAPLQVKEAIGLQVWMVRTVMEGAKHGILVSFARVQQNPEPVPVDLPSRPAALGSTARH